MIANLWDVTDRDIDRLCHALLQHWLGGHTHSRAGGQGRGPMGVEEEVVMRGAGGVCVSLSGSLGSSRSACKLGHLIGAAPVCYGLPAQLAWKAERGGGGA